MLNEELKETLKQRADAERKRTTLRNSLNDTQQRIEELKTTIKSAEDAISLALDNFVDGKGTQADIDNARGTVQKLKTQQIDTEALVESYEKSIARREKELQVIAQKIPGLERSLWLSVADDFAEKARKAVGELLLKTIAAQYLAGNSSLLLRNPVSDIFFNKPPKYTQGLSIEHLRPFIDQLTKEFLQ